MNAIRTSVASLPFHRLAQRIAWVWGCALSGDVADAACNAVTPLALQDWVTLDDVRASCAGALMHRRDVRAPGFERLTDTQCEYLAGLAVMLWETHAEELRPSSPPAAYVEPHDADCGCPECDDDDAPSRAELLEHDAREHSRCGTEVARWL